MIKNIDWLSKKISIQDSDETIIAKGSIFEGTMESTNTIIINGGYIGNNLKGSKVIINQGAQVKTNIYTDVFVLKGTLIGNVNASHRVILDTTAKLAGDIVSPELLCSEGVSFEGACKITREKENVTHEESIAKEIKNSFQKEITQFKSSQ